MSTIIINLPGGVRVDSIERALALLADAEGLRISARQRPRGVEFDLQRTHKRRVPAVTTADSVGEEE